MWIKTVSDDEAEGVVARIFEGQRQRSGAVDNVIRAHSPNAAALDAMMRFYRGLMHGDCDLETRQREMIAVTVSAINECHY